MADPKRFFTRSDEVIALACATFSAKMIFKTLVELGGPSEEIRGHVTSIRREQDGCWIEVAMLADRQHRIEDAMRARAATLACMPDTGASVKFPPGSLFAMYEAGKAADHA